MSKVIAGLLPLYLKLYDDSMPERREQAAAIVEQSAAGFQDQGIEIIQAPVCRTRSEFEEGVAGLEKNGAQVIVTLHLAYSPSLESAEVLAQTGLPVVILDTTQAYDFSPSQEPEQIMYNHGIHGVQDMCNLLIRNGKQFTIEAGHVTESDVLKRTADHVKAIANAFSMESMRIGLIGEQFNGMGDFQVPFESLKQEFGIEPVCAAPTEMKALADSVTQDEIEAEIASDIEKFECDGLDKCVHEKGTRSGLALRKWIEQEDLKAFSMNFLAFTRVSGMVVPFLEASKAMSRKIGYAGEGDILTAALVHTLMANCGDTTFTEMFCPDWKGNSIFMSHMGEVNTECVTGKARLIEKPFPYTDADNPVAPVGCLKEGDGSFVNIAPGPGNIFSLIIIPGKMNEVRGEDKMEKSVHGWFAPEMEIADCLAEYSRAGGTHHSAFVYGDSKDKIAAFGRKMGWAVKIIK
jgi:L-arabinose isomerase